MNEKTFEDINSAITEAKNVVLERLGRSYASDMETWAELKRELERAQKTLNAAGKAHKEMWDSVAQGDEDACSAYLAEVRSRARELCFVGVGLAAMAELGGEAW